jgi:hypothetical protein
MQSGFQIDSFKISIGVSIGHQYSVTGPAAPAVPHLDPHEHVRLPLRVQAHDARLDVQRAAVSLPAVRELLPPPRLNCKAPTDWILSTE